METETRRIADELAIRDVLHRYALGLDRGDVDMQRACFTADVEAEYGGHRLPAGVDAILRLNRGARGFVSTMHHVGTIVVTELTDNAAATESYALACLLEEAGAGGGHVLTTRGVLYSDRFRREGEHWRICRRVHRVLWATRQEAQANPVLPASFLRAAGLAGG